MPCANPQNWSTIILDAKFGVKLHVLKFSGAPKIFWLNSLGFLIPFPGGDKQHVKGGVLPAYCDPPNPCPQGYTAEDGCIEVMIIEQSSGKTQVNGLCGK